MFLRCLAASSLFAFAPVCVNAQQASAPIVLHAARLLQVDSGAIVQPGEILVEGNLIRAVGTSVEHPAGRKDH